MIAHPHEEGFKSIHNSAKSRALTVLYWLSHKLGYPGGHTVKQLTNSSGVGYLTLKSSLGNWTYWKYVVWRPIDDGARPKYCYGIAARGEKCIERRIPRSKRLDV